MWAQHLIWWWNGYFLCFKRVNLQLVRKITQTSGKIWVVHLLLNIGRRIAQIWKPCRKCKLGIWLREITTRCPIAYTWALKFKCFTWWLINKFKYALCDCFDQQFKGVDLFKKYDPVIHWTHIWLILIFEVLLGLKYKQLDAAVVFLHTNVYKGKNI